MILPAASEVRKDMPIATGVVDYFPLALAEIAIVSRVGNDQHSPGQPLHWERGISTDHADCIARHLIDRGCRDTDGMRHSAKLAWRALALLQTELEEEHARQVAKLNDACQIGFDRKPTTVPPAVAATLTSEPPRRCADSF